MPQMHRVPTHLRAPETVLTFGGVNLSARQFLLLLLGCALGYDGWLHLAALALVPGGQVIRLVLALVPCALAAALAFIRVAGRDLLAWLLVLLQYRVRPHRLVWRSVRLLEASLLLDEAAKEQEEETDA